MHKIKWARVAGLRDNPLQSDLDHYNKVICANMFEKLALLLIEEGGKKRNYSFNRPDHVRHSFKLIGATLLTSQRSFKAKKA